MSGPATAADTAAAGPPETATQPAPAPREAASAGRWPQQCELCRGWNRQPICADCLARFAAPRLRCPRCALASPLAQVCGACLQRPPLFDAALTAVDYAFPWDGLIARFKFQQQPELARALAERMLPAGRGAPRPDLLLPMPLGEQRLRERGYNQAWELARVLGRCLQLPVAAHLLRRWRDTPHQVGLSREERVANLRDGLWVATEAGLSVRDCHVAVVDDVMTTGASADAAARALHLAGAAHVSVWVVARTPAPA